MEQFAKVKDEKMLNNKWDKGKNLAWQPDWANGFSIRIENKEVFLVPLIPKLYGTTGRQLPFKLVGGKRFILTSQQDSVGGFYVMTFVYNPFANDEHLTNQQFIAKFTGNILNEDIKGRYVNIFDYKSGNNSFIAGKNINKSTIVTTNTGPVTCITHVKCYWSAYCSVDQTTYGTITTGVDICLTPFTNAGSCNSYSYTGSLWQQVGTDQDQYCYYSGADFGADFSSTGTSMGQPGLIPKDRPCPGDPLPEMRIAASSAGDPGNIKGGTFGPDVRWVRHKDGTFGPGQHEGTDLACPPGNPVYAAQSGIVYSTRDSYPPGKYVDASYGNFVWIKNIDGTYYKYNHMDAIKAGLTPGKSVNQGAQIGISGSTGNAAAKSVVNKHVHLQMFDANLKPIDPQPHLKTKFDMATGKGRRPC